MADIRNIAGQVPAPRAQPQSVRSETIRAAQRAFFEAALSGTASSPAAQPQPTPLRTTASATVQRADATPPNRILRPGSLVDIKV